MQKTRKVTQYVLFAGMAAGLTGCGGSNVVSPAPSTNPINQTSTSVLPADPKNYSNTPGSSITNDTHTTVTNIPQDPSSRNTSIGTGAGASLQVVTDPSSITVLVNKTHVLSSDYVPPDLVNDPNIPFIFSGYDEKRLMRRVMAQALQKLIAGAKQDGINLAGVSAYRSYQTQKAVFDDYVKQDGLAKAETYSAPPGSSEHETGLAIDLSGSSGQCAAADCFDGSKEANWIAANCAKYGFILRYPKGKEAITGYEYESWHIRYLGVQLAQDITSKGLTYKEYFNAQSTSLK